MSRNYRGDTHESGSSRVIPRTGMNRGLRVTGVLDSEEIIYIPVCLQQNNTWIRKRINLTVTVVRLGGEEQG